MPLDASPGEILTKTRDGVRDQYRDDFALRVPAADTGPGTAPYVDASVFADGMQLVLNDAQVIGRGTNTRTSAGVWLANIGEPEGVFKRPAVGATGYVTITASAGGGTILYGTEIKEPNSQLRFQTIGPTGLYQDGDEIAISGVDTGPATNFAAGTVLQFTSPPPGIGLLATVTTQADGTGLSGGRLEDSDEEYRLLIEERRANPPASGNVAEYLRQIENTAGHGIGVEKGFVYPAVLGPSTIAFTFTIRASKLGGSRLPNAAEIAAVLAYVIGLEPADDTLLGFTLLGQPVVVALRPTWTTGASGWTDVRPWPVYVPGDKVRIDNAVTPTPTLFRLTTATSTDTPQVGQTIAFFDAENAIFQRKRILTVTVIVAGKSWTITVDPSNGASDLTYTPTAGQAASPYSLSLDALVAPVQGYFAGLGPGEQLALLPDPGRRGRRQPQSPEAWPSVINNRIIGPILDVPAVSDVTLLEPTNPTATTVGSPAVVAYLLELGDLCAFA